MSCIQLYQINYFYDVSIANDRLRDMLVSVSTESLPTADVGLTEAMLSSDYQVCGYQHGKLLASYR